MRKLFRDSGYPTPILTQHKFSQLAAQSGYAQSFRRYLPTIASTNRSFETCPG